MWPMGLLLLMICDISAFKYFYINVFSGGVKSNHYPRNVFWETRQVFSFEGDFYNYFYASEIKVGRGEGADTCQNSDHNLSRFSTLNLLHNQTWY